MMKMNVKSGSISINDDGTMSVSEDIIKDMNEKLVENDDGEKPIITSDVKG